MPSFNIGSDVSDGVWRSISEEYAKRVSGEVRRILTRPVNSGVWLDREKQIVLANQSAITVIEVDLLDNNKLTYIKGGP